MAPSPPSLTDLYHPPSNPTPSYTSSYPFISPLKYRSALTGKTVLITGAGRGIGRAAALAFAAAGADVVCVARTQSDLDDVVHAINTANQDSTTTRPTAMAIAGDVTDPSFAARVVGQIAERFPERKGVVDILVNNAGLSRVSDLEHEEGIEAPWRVVEVSLKGSMAFTQAVVPGMIRRFRVREGSEAGGDGGRKSLGAGGTIINVTSIIARIPHPYFSAYAAAKAGLIAYTASIDLELRASGIATFAVHPCMTLETTIAHPPCVNEDAMREVPGMKGWMEGFAGANTDHVDLPADTFVALCCEARARVLSGRFVDGTYGLEEQIRGAEREVEMEKDKK